MIAHKLEHTETRTSEGELIAQAKADPSQFQALYELHFDAVFCYLYKRLETEDQAFDLTQEVFIKALRKLSDYEDRGKPFLAWLYRISFTTVTDYYRKTKKMRTVSLSDASLENLKAEVAEKMSLKEAGVLHALQSLKEEEMELIQLRFFEEKSFKEISAILNVNLNAAQVRVHRIIKKLRAKIHGQV